MKFIEIFCELSNNQKVFSWRKAGTSIIFLVFACANIGYLVTHEFNELPGSYQAIISGVFAFYFGKDLISGKKLVVKDK